MPVFRVMYAALVVGAACLTVPAADPPANVSAQNAPDKITAKPAPAKPSPTKAAPVAKPPVAKPPVAKPTAAKPPAPLSAERETAALAFAREHHAELAALIEKLHRDNRRDYDRAIRELAQASERLTRLKKQSAELYELSLAAWKLDSRTQLLAARMTMSQTPALETELKQLLAERADVRLKEFKSERVRLQDRLTKLNVSIQALETDKNAVVEKDLLRIKRAVAARSRRPAPRPANKPSQPAIASKAIVSEPPRPPAVPTTAASVTPPAASRANDKQH
ncbi:MAG TPA: hypothetical protein VG055_11410 [Planctomycetaceae bacterium]|jgi:hypothetical protein|nr:hypothetical protein [Planctomycetaceae bacterium]